MKKQMVGLVFGELKVIKEIEKRNHNNHIMYLCICSCGNEKEILGASLRAGTTRSCGCFNVSCRKTHGMEGTPTYKCYQQMKQRCYNKKNKRFKDWGGRGIKVCDRWLVSFENFINDMGEKPESYSLDRIDNDIDYSKDNCKWSSPKEQANNRRGCVRVEHDGEVITVEEYAIKVGLTQSGARKRIHRTMVKINGTFVKEADL